MELVEHVLGKLHALAVDGQPLEFALGRAVERQPRRDAGRVAREQLDGELQIRDAKTAFRSGTQERATAARCAEDRRAGSA